MQQRVCPPRPSRHMAAGASMGVATGELAISLAIGIALGTALGAIWQRVERS